MAPRFYVDEDAHQDLATTLAAIGLDALSTRDTGNKRFSDGRQLAFATDQGRAIITCNKRDFRLLHEVLALWMPRAGRAMMEAHAGIIIVPNGRDMGLEETTEIVAELTALVDETSMRGRLFEWVGSGGWSEWRG